MADGRIVIDTELNKKPAEKGFGDLQKSMESAAKKAQAVGIEMTKYLTVPLTALGGMAFAAADDLDKAYRDIQVGTGATGKALEELKQDFKNVFQDVPNSAEEVANTLTALNGYVGATDETLQDLTKAVLDASRVLGEDDVNNAEAFGKAMNQFQREAEDGTDILDGLFRMTQDYGVGLGEVTGYLNTYGSVLKNAGFTMEESAELFSRLSANGISVSRIMPGLNSAFRKWASEGKNSQEELQKVIESMREAETETEALAIATETFGAEGAQRLTTAVRNGAFAIDDLGEVMENSQGIIEQTAEETLTFGEKLANLKNQTMIGLEPLGEILIEMAEQWLPPIIDLVTRMAEWFQNLSPQMQKAAVIAGIVVAAIGPFLTMLPMIISFLKGLGIAFAALTSPIGLAVAAVAAVIAIGVLLWKNWDTIKEKAREFGQAVKDRIQEMRDRVKERIRNMINSALEWFENLRQKAVEKVTKLKDRGVAIFHEMWNGIKSFFLSVLKGGLLGVINDYILKPFFDIDLFQIGKDIINGLWRGISSMAGTLKKNIEGFINKYVPGPVKKILGIASPSKLFMELGEDTGEGFEIGLAKSMKNIMKQAQNLAQAAVPEIQPTSIQPTMGAMVATGTGGGSIGDIYIRDNVFHIREEADIEKVSRQLFKMALEQSRGPGGRL